MEPGLRWVDRYAIRLDETTFAPSRALLEVGLYDATTGERPSIQLEESEDALSGPPVVDHALRFLPVQIEPRSGPVPNPLAFRLEDRLALVGWDVDRRLIPAEETLQLTLYWEGLDDMRQDYQVTTQLVREDRRKAAQFDAAPGGIPTSTWRKGQQVVDHRELRVEAGAPPGGYEIVLSAYWWDTPETIKRLRVIDAEGTVLPSDSLVLGWVRVTP
jgi:hypothetical protein